MIKERRPPRPSTAPGLLRVVIDALDEDGAGVGGGPDAGGRRVHVPFALPGEIVKAEIEHESPHRPEAWARLIAVERASPDRVPPACAAFGRCGGCALQHLAYERQLEWKRALLEAALRRAGVGAPVFPCVPSPRTRGYRDNAKLVFGVEDGRLILGAYAPRSHAIVDLAGCAVVEPPLDAVARSIAGAAARLGLPAYVERTGEGLLRYALLRVTSAGRVAVMLVVSRRGGAATRDLGRAIREAHPEVEGVVENLQPSRGNALVGAVEPDVLLDGEAALVEQVGPVRLRLSPRAFFQSNREVAARLYADVADAAALAPGERAIDAYSGAGGIALTLARRGAEVLGVEENPAAVEDARASVARNAEGAEPPRARFEAGDAAALLAPDALAARGFDRPAAIVLDPPRRGCPTALLDACARLGPRRVLYVSCWPPSLARDLAALERLGLRVLRVTPYDMLPDTPHVEALAELAPIASS